MKLIRNTLAALILALLPFQAQAVDDLWDYSTTPSSNTNVGGVSMAEAMLPGLVNDGIRALIAQLKKGVYNKGTDIASATTTNICATGTSVYVDITGTTTITGFGTAAAGCWRILQFDGALTLTHNATSLIIPNGSNITTQAGDVVGAISEGSGNWRVIFFSRVPFLATANTFTAAQTISLTAAGTVLDLRSSDAGAGSGPNIQFYRNSASPAANDILNNLTMNGNDSGATFTQYAGFFATIIDPTDASEDGRLTIRTQRAGATADWTISSGEIHAPGLSAQGTNGSINATGLYVNGHGTVAQRVTDTETAYTTLGTILPFDDTIPQNTEGDEVLSVAITPTNASSVLSIEANLLLGVGVANGIVSCAVFVDTTASAIYAGALSVGTSGRMETLRLVHYVSAGSTSARTYKVRCGSSVATDAKLNGDDATRIFGGVAVSSMEVEETLPQ